MPIINTFFAAFILENVPTVQAEAEVTNTPTNNTAHSNFLMKKILLKY